MIEEAIKQYLTAIFSVPVVIPFWGHALGTVLVFILYGVFIKEVGKFIEDTNDGYELISIAMLVVIALAWAWLAALVVSFIVPCVCIGLLVLGGMCIRAFLLDRKKNDRTNRSCSGD